MVTTYYYLKYFAILTGNGILASIYESTEGWKISIAKLFDNFCDRCIDICVAVARQTKRELDLLYNT
jgi:hypothetical protein